MMVWDKESGKVYPVEWTTGNKPEDDMPGIMQSPFGLIIARSGLGKKIMEVFKSKNACWRFDHRQQNKDRGRSAR